MSVQGYYIMQYEEIMNNKRARKVNKRNGINELYQLLYSKLLKKLKLSIIIYIFILTIYIK